MADITLSGEPKSTSHIYQYACRGRFPTMYMTAKGKAIKEAYQWEAKSQWEGKPIEGDIQVYAKIYFGTKRRCDVDNFSKIMLDSLTGIAWVDDSQIRRMTVEKFYDKDNPRIEIEINQYDQN